MPEEEKNKFCGQPLGPWIAGIVFVTIMLVFWVIMRRKEIVMGVEAEELKAQMSAPPPPQVMNEPKFPREVRAAAFPAQQPGSAKNYSLAAITKATPGGGFQLVANTDSKFQNSLKDSVNTIIPSVCDIHARHIVRTPVRQTTDAQGFKFVPPFTGAIDKFVENKGFENVGAGIIVDDRGYVLTNSHVTLEATDIVVTVFGNPSRDLKADIVAQEPNLDLSLLKLRADGPFPEAKLGDSSFTQIGDYVIAVGSPFGIEQTVTSGIISGIRKSLMIEGVRYQNLFQTDTPINRGSSGGPLVNLDGEVVGVNTAIYAPTGVFSGTGFTIPINDCKDFLAANLGRNFTVPVDQKGMVTGKLPVTAMSAPVPIHFGLEVMPVSHVVARQFGIGEGQGVLVNRVVDESPASFAGIQRGDVITSIAGVLVSSKDEVQKVVTHFRPGDNVNVRIIRNGKTDELLVKVQ
ncbi:MAG: trypsin-like peptidase domain-containing protein [Candidatus Omnitrophica bacterium]|nr:trypsin-like peptidase domain-containing protein [Candidatus Omnitrophota bacterium]